MRTITKNLYTLRELIALPGVTSEAINKAKQHLMIHETEHDWWDFTYQTWQSALSQIGFEEPEIQFRGFWSQGDGASFTSRVDIQKLVEFFAAKIAPKKCIEPTPATGDREDFRPWLVHEIGGKYTSDRFRKLLWAPNNIELSVNRNSSRYVHWNSCYIDWKEIDRTQGHTRFWSLFKDFREYVENLRKDLCRAIYKDLEDLYSDLISDENLLAVSDDYEIHFDSSGNWESAE